MARARSAKQVREKQSLARSIGSALKWMSLSVVVVVAVVVVAYVTHEVIGEAPLRALSDATAPIGWWLVVGAASVFVVDIAALTAYTIRYGQSEDGESADGDAEGPVADPVISPSLSNIPFTRLSKVKILGQRSGYVTMESLLDGTATFGERLMVLGITLLFVLISLIIAGFALQLTYVPIFAVPMLGMSGLLLFVNVREVWRDYRRAKAKVRRRSSEE